MEELLIKKIEAGIRKIKNGNALPNETNLGVLFNKLKPIKLYYNNYLISNGIPQKPFFQEKQ